MRRNEQLFLILIVILIGFGLRVYQLGYDSLWNDEAGQALAAIQPTLRDLFAVERSHAMAMPMDYLVSRLVSKVGVQETVMRFPSLVYGTLTLALFFSFAKSISRFEVAAVAVWLLSLFAPHIHYSQELRFYSALGLFYALSNILLFRALRRSRSKDWILFVIITSLGIYFHPYVLLVVVNGLLYIFLTDGFSRRAFEELARLSAIAVILGLVFLPGYLYFGASQEFNYDLTQWVGSVSISIAQGLGWVAFPYPMASSGFGLWELMSLVFAVVGLIISVSYHQKYAYMISIVGGTFVQVTLIVLANWIKGYPFVSRQIVHLAPTMLILTSLGIVSVLDYLLGVLKRHSVENTKPVVLFFVVVIQIITVVTALPRISNYYASPRNGRQLSDELLRVCRDLPIYVIPGYEEKIYRFYLSISGDPESERIIQELRPSSLGNLEEVLSENQREMCVIMPAITSLQQECFESLRELGFTVMVAPEVNWYGASFLLAR